MGKVLGEQAFCGARDEYEGEVRIILDYMRKLGDEVLANTTGA